jgi:hypothetical protein
MGRGVERKRPCRFCRVWFRPNPRQKGRQYACSDPECQRARHRLNCADWRRDNPDYDRESRLRERLKNGRGKGPYGELGHGIDLEVARDAIGLQPFVVVDEFCKVLLEMARDSLLAQGLGTKAKSHQHPPSGERDGMAGGRAPP